MVLLLLIRVYDVSKISLILGECCEARANTGEKKRTNPKPSRIPWTFCGFSCVAVFRAVF